MPPDIFVNKIKTIQDRCMPFGICMEQSFCVMDSEFQHDMCTSVCVWRLWNLPLKITFSTEFAENLSFLVCCSEVSQSFITIASKITCFEEKLNIWTIIAEIKIILENFEIFSMKIWENIWKSRFSVAFFKLSIHSHWQAHHSETRYTLHAKTLSDICQTACIYLK